MPNRTRASSGKVASNPDRPADISGGANASAKHPTHSAPPESHQGTSKKVGGEGQRRHSPNGRGRWNPTMWSAGFFSHPPLGLPQGV